MNAPNFKKFDIGVTKTTACNPYPDTPPHPEHCKNGRKRW